MVEEVEQAVVGPVEVFEHQHERPPLRERLEQATPGGERLFAALARGSVECEQQPQVTLDPLGLPRVGDEVAHCAVRASPPPSPRRRVSRIPAWALTISPSAQNVTPSPYGRQRPRRQVTSPGSSSSARWSSQTSRLLPIPGTPTASPAERCGRGERGRACPGSGSAPPCGRRAERAAGSRAPPSGRRSPATPRRRRPGRLSRAPGAAGARRTRSRPCVARYVDSPTSTESTSAASSIRNVVVTTSPVAIPSPAPEDAPSWTTASPVFTADANAAEPSRGSRAPPGPHAPDRPRERPAHRRRPSPRRPRTSRTCRRSPRARPASGRAVA